MIGTTLCSRYRVLEKIGEGGMGVVYKALDEVLKIPVAVKVLRHSSRANDTARQRFLQEALQLAPMSHPNVVRVSNFCQDQGVDCLVMDFVPGTTLDEVLSGGPLPESEVVKYGVQMADGLSAAHAENLTHRDLKPGNLRITPKGRLMILDFGLAKKFLDSTASTASGNLTEENTVPGTLPYMAPEQLLGRPADSRVDIYAAGAVLYEMATGQMLFPGRTRPELHDAILGEEPRRPRLVNPAVSARLERVILKSIAKDSNSRYQDAAALQSDLERIGRGDEGRVPLMWAGAAFALVLVVMGATVIPKLLPALFSRSGPKMAVLPFVNEPPDSTLEYWADGMTEGLIRHLGSLVSQQGITPNQLTVISWPSVMKYKHAPDALRQIGRDLGVLYVIDGSVRKEGSRIRITAHLERVREQTQMWTNAYTEEVVNVFEVQDKIAKTIVQNALPQLLGKLHWRPARAPTVSPAAQDAYYRGRTALNLRTEAGMAEAIRYFEQATAADGLYAAAHAGIADACILSAGYGYRAPGEAMNRACDEARVALALDSTLAEAHTSLASVLQDRDWDWDGAEREFKRALELDDSYATAHQWYASLLASTGDMDGAVGQLARAAELDPLSSIIRTDLGTCYLNQHRYADAIAQYRRTFAADSNFGAEYSGLLVIALWLKGDHRAAAAELEKTLARSGDAEGVQTLRLAIATSGDTGLWRWQLGRLQDMAQDAYVSPFQFAQTHALLGERDAAFAWLEKAFLEHSGSLASLRVSPMFDALRSDPRYASLLRRMKLTP